MKNLCTSERFHENVGLDVCLSAQRPEFRSLRNIIQSIRDRENDMDVLEDDDDFDFGAQDDDDEDNDNDVDRPMVTLVGPYKYEVKIMLLFYC